MSWYGIDYSGSRSPVYMFGNYSRLFPKADPNNKVYRNHIANEVREARRNNIDNYRAHRGYSADKQPDKSYDERIKGSIKAAYANNQAAATRARITRGALGAGALGVGLGAHALYKRYQARKAVRLAAQQGQ